MRYDVVIIGGGLAATTAAEELQKKGLKCAIVAEGHSLRDVNPSGIVRMGGSYFAGDRVLRSVVEDGTVTAVYTQKLEDEPLIATWYILATGKYFSKGLKADMRKVYEPIFGLDVAALEDRADWFNQNFSEPQKFMEFGVKNFGKGKVCIDGMAVHNLFAAGEILAGITGIEKDAEEIIRKSALEAASNIR